MLKSWKEPFLFNLKIAPTNAVWIYWKDCPTPVTTWVDFLANPNTFSSLIICPEGLCFFEAAMNVIPKKAPGKILKAVALKILENSKRSNMFMKFLRWHIGEGLRR